MCVNQFTFASFLQFTLLSPAEQRMSTAIGVPESFVVRQAAGQTVKKVERISEDLWDDIKMDCKLLTEL